MIHYFELFLALLILAISSGYTGWEFHKEYIKNKEKKKNVENKE